MIENAFNKPDPDLLPCPLCGNSDVFFMKPVSGVGNASILCSTPGCIEMGGTIIDGGNLHRLAERWNRRIEKSATAATHGL